MAMSPLYFLISILLLLIFSAIFAKIKMIIHNFLEYGYFDHLWLKYTVFYFFAFGLRIVYSQVINDRFAYTWPILVLIIVSEYLIFYNRYYIMDDKKKYFGFLIASTAFGSIIVSLLFATTIVFLILLV